MTDVIGQFAGVPLLFSDNGDGTYSPKMVSQGDIDMIGQFGGVPVGFVKNENSNSYSLKVSIDLQTGTSSSTSKLSRVYLSSAVTDLTTAFGGTVPFDTEDIDENGAWNIVQPDRFVISSDGNYRVQFSGYGQIDAGTNIEFQLILVKDSITEIGSDYLSTTTTIVGYKWLTATYSKYFSAGDEIFFGYTFASGTGQSVRLFSGSFATLEKI